MAMTFRQLEVTKNIVWDPNDQPKSALGDWYERVRDIPIDEMKIGDICRTVRQLLYFEYVVPLAVELLEKEPLAGELYEGELFMSFSSIKDGYWKSHPYLAERISRFGNQVLAVLGGNLPTQGDIFYQRLQSFLD